MAKMKDSCVIWIGDVPENWGIKRIRHTIRPDEFGIRVGPFGSSLTDAVVGENQGQYKVYGQANLIRHDFSFGDNYVTEQNFYRLKNYEVMPEDVLLSMMGTIGKCSVVPDGIQPGIMDSHLIKIRLGNIMFPKYFEFVYEQSGLVFEQLLLNSKGSIMNGLNSGIVKDVFVPIPPISEQCAIAAFLDDRCRQIDGIIADLERQVEILRQYKKAVITETVRVNKQHWMKGRIKDLMTLQRGYDLPQDDFVEGDYPVYGSNGIVGWHNKATTNGPGVTVGRSGSVGEVNYVDRNFWAHNTSIFVKNPKCNDMRFLYYVLLSFDIKELASGSAVPTLDRKNVEAVHLLFPTSLQEQQAIVAYLDTKCTEVDALIIEKQRADEVMRQYKKSLIYEYVTGKKRVVS